MKAALIKKRDSIREKYPEAGCFYLISAISTLVLVPILLFLCIVFMCLGEFKNALLLFLSAVAFTLLHLLIEVQYLYDKKDFDQIQMLELQLHEVQQIEDVQKICEKYKLKLVSL